MQIRDAANTGRALIIVHLIVQCCLCAFNIIRMLPMMRQQADPTWLITSSLHYALALLLDIALLIVLGSLARTREQIIHETEDI